MKQHAIHILSLVTIEHST